MRASTCRFVLQDVDISEIRDIDSFDVFEPKLVLELGGENCFQRFGFPDSGQVVVVDFVDQALEETLLMVRQVAKGAPEGRHEFELTASLWLLVVDRVGQDLTITLDGTSRGDVRRAEVAGLTTVRDWIAALARLASEILDLFKRENPGAYDHLSDWSETVDKLSRELQASDR